MATAIELVTVLEALEPLTTSKDIPMKTLTLDTLVTVTGGAGKNDAVTQQLTTLQGAIKDLAATQNKSGGSTDTMTMMMMAMALRPQPTAVVAAPAAGPIINIRTRFRR